MAGDGNRIVWLGHATVLVALDGTRLLTDPVLRRRVIHLRRTAALEGEHHAAPDAMLVSHLHWDHFDLRSLAAVGRGVPVVVPRGGGRLLTRRGFTDVTEVDAGEEVRVGSVVVRATPAEHDASRGPFGVRAPSLGYVATGTKTVYFAGDTDLFDGMREIGGDLDVALLPVAGWGRRTPAGHLDPEAAAQALTLLRPRAAIPVHYGTLMPLHRREPYEPGAGEAFAAHARLVAPEVTVHVLNVGETLELDAPGVHPIRAM